MTPNIETETMWITATFKMHLETFQWNDNFENLM